MFIPPENAVKAIQLIGTVPRYVDIVTHRWPTRGKIWYQAHTLTGIQMQNLFSRMDLVQVVGVVALDDPDKTPLANGDFKHQLVPASCEVTPTLDMAFLIAMYGLSLEVEVPATIAWCGEVSPNGTFIPLASPLAVGKLALELNLEVAVPDCSAEQVALTGAKVRGLRDVCELIDLLLGKQELITDPPESYGYVSPVIDPWADLKYVKGQENAKLALEVAMAGGHNLLLVGPPGEAKSELGKRSYTIAPYMTLAEAIDVTWMHQAAMRVDGNALVTTRPFNMATKETSPVGLKGGGDAEGPVPGLVSLSHNGVLMADEIFEWSKTKMDALRIPLQDRSVSIVRKDWQVKYPANFQLVATANPCPCGFYGHPDIPCRCTPSERRRYVQKMSGPIMDRIDMKVWMPPLGGRIFEQCECETSETIQKRVQRAADVQAERYKDAPIHRNCELGPGYFDVFCNETQDAMNAMMKAQHTYGLTSRGVSILRKVSRTCADLEGRDEVQERHVERASSFMELAILREAASSG